LENANTMLYHSTDAEKFATLFYAILDVSTHRVCFANAGHNYPYLISQNGDIQRLKTIGIPLGFLEQFEFSEHSVAFVPGDLLLAFSDGISEAMNSFAEEYGEQQLQYVIVNHRNDSAQIIVQTIIDSVNHFTSGNEQTDDMTLICLKRLI
jgi:sigma-B regulation protein RsbU (phosphoserine phosphatase)